MKPRRPNLQLRMGHRHRAASTAITPSSTGRRSSSTYIHRQYERPLLAALYRLARVGFVTPLRDGMNLVAKEYLSAQDPEDPGVLVLSRFAGAARELTGALIVNPMDIDGMAEALARALSMPVAERRSRYEDMIAQLRENNVSVWRDNFLRDVASGGQLTAR
ncbi:MAG: Trehalose-6-phosphate synthase [Burkholderia gladioli]|nr:MAG: Trehalose-6-phosphate synthase [Burkholderia gladioli]